LGAQFVRDETIPDGSFVAPGTKLKKIWILRNTGTSTWTPSSTAVSYN
jgi:Ig-like domain from next to BRCA1 gene